MKVFRAKTTYQAVQFTGTNELEIQKFVPGTEVVGGLTKHLRVPNGFEYIPCMPLSWVLKDNRDQVYVISTQALDRSYEEITENKNDRSSQIS